MDSDDQHKVEISTQERDQLYTSRENRRVAFNEVFVDFFTDLKTKIDSNKKCRKRVTLERIRFYTIMEKLTTKVFETTEDEYEYINKFGRGIWDTETLHKMFNKTEFDTVVQIAQSYGAFDY
jgi:ubiquinone/menaquinone biosynthesis C-methylase UbiE